MRSPLACRRSASILSLVLCALLGAAATARPAATKGQRAAKVKVATVKRETLEGGDHWHLVTAKGRIHVWRPPGYRRKSAGIVLYVHGYHITADQSWSVHRLAEQFKASRQNALFLVVDGPTSREDKVRFPDLGKLLQLVRQATHLTLPRGHVVAIGHSGGFRTLVEWLPYTWLDHLILLDALYANEKIFEAWLTTAEKFAWHRMFLVGSDTRAKCEAFLKQLRIGSKRKPIPLEHSGFTRRERGARLLYLDSQYEHTQIVSGRKVIPLLLRLTRLKRL
jgi:hypothetical protein